VSGGERRTALVEEIVEGALRRHSTAAVLFHHAVAERLGLGPTDLKCLDLLREGGPMIGTALAARTGLTTGAVTGVVARLERAGFVRREPDPRDGRKQMLHVVLERIGDLKAVFGPLRGDVADLLEAFDARQLAGIAEFLERTTEAVHRHVALLRAAAHHPTSPAEVARSAP